jgi:hypothetical protein
MIYATWLATTKVMQSIPTYMYLTGYIMPNPALARHFISRQPTSTDGYGSIPIPFEKAGQTPMWQSRQSSVVRRSVLLLAPRTAVVHFLVILSIAI